MHGGGHTVAVCRRQLGEGARGKGREGGKAMNAKYVPVHDHEYKWSLWVHGSGA